MPNPTIPAPNMKESDNLPPVELEEEEELQKAEPEVKEEPEIKEEPEAKEDEAKKEIEEAEVSFDDFLKEKGDSGVFPSTKKEPEVKKEVEADANARDYSDLTAEETDLLKKAGNKTFAYVKPILIEHKQLKQQVEAQAKELADLKVGKVTYPDSIYEHESAYVLTPEFNRINNNKVSAEAVLSHWQKQAVLIRKGKDWQDIIEDDKGNMRLAEPKPSTDEDEATVMNNIAFAQRQLSQHEKVFDDFTSNFRSRHQADVAQIKKAETDYFPDYDKPDHITAKIQKETLEALPASLRKNPLAPLVCKLVGAAKLLEYRYNQLAKQKTKEETTKAKIEELERKNGPKEGETLGGGTKAKPPISFKDFQSAKEE